MLMRSAVTDPFAIYLACLETTNQHFLPVASALDNDRDRAAYPILSAFTFTDLPFTSLQVKLARVRPSFPPASEGRNRPILRSPQRRRYYSICFLHLPSAGRPPTTLPACRQPAVF